ncbi:MAG TPA: TonB-dependent receptor [Puia sp.]|nr:TonB-dependent receptor [Puia sp.]
MRVIYEKIFLIVTISALSTLVTYAQNEKLITGNFSGLSFEQFVDSVESQSDYHFFFKPQDIEGFYIDITIKAGTLKTILDLAFKGSDFRYSIDQDNHVFVLKKFRIETTLGEDFFDIRKNKSDSIKNQKLNLADFTEENKNEKIKSSLENKLYEIGARTNTIGQGNSTIAGYVRDSKSGETIAGAVIFIDKPPVATTTDQLGYYSLNIPKGNHVLRISSAGMRSTSRQIILYADGKLNIELQEYVPTLKAVIVSAEKLSNIKGLQMGVERLNIKVIKQTPVVFGEADVLRTIITLPGVTSVGEASTGFNVRGGSTDENLILFNNATIYNPSHLFGFFSAFNPDLVKDVELYKSNIPEKFGGRLSSVLDITAKEGNKKKFSGSGGISPLTTRLVLEGPIDSGKTSFLIGGRTTYSDWLLKQIPNNEYRNSSASFYDINASIHHEFNSKNSLYLMGYMSNDQFRLNSDTLYKYRNKNANISWKHVFTNKFYGTLGIGYDGYQYSVSSSKNPVNAYKLAFDINQYNLKADFNYTLNSKHTLDFGLDNIYYQLHPGSYTPNGSKSLVVPDYLQTEQALESALYAGDKFAITPNFTINAGIRYSLYNYLGAHDVYEYAPGLPREEINLIDTISYPKGKFIKTYQGPEYRASVRYALTENASIKASYNSGRQYIHVISNTTSISPTDIWKLSDPNIMPQTGDQFSLGFYHNFKSNIIETSLEVYYKRIHNYLDYKSGAILIMNHHIETDVTPTKGKAYGAELLIKKTTGKLNGWFSYTYSRTLLQQDDPIAGQTINDGKYYPANFDKPHNVNFIGNYKFSHRFSVSLNITYSTGRPITLPVAIYDLGGSQRVFYSERNQFRVPDYFRTDLSMNIEGNHKIKKFKHSSWTIGFYNLTGRKNPYSIYFIEENGEIKGYKLSIFGTVIPSITYNFKF